MSLKELNLKWSYLSMDIDLKKSFKKFLDFIKKWQKNILFLIPLTVVVFVLMIIAFFNTYSNYQSLNKKSNELSNLQYFDINFLKSSQYTQSESKNLKTIQDLLDLQDNSNEELQKYNEYLEKLQSPYTYFLQYIYLPKLNVWKNLYTQEINTDLLWLDFLENNSYSDILLVQKRSDFFKNVWENNEFNQIQDIQIWDVIEESNWLFKISVNVSFVANSKRSFLLLVDKLATTSNKNSISLINEFMYGLWAEIKDKKISEVESYTNLLKKRSDFDQIFLDEKKEINFDKIIWFNLYNWVFNNQETNLINDEVIKSVISKLVSCNNISESICLYQFREKYRDIPMLAYWIWKENETQKTLNLKSFLASIPWLMNITQFTFDKVKWQQITKDEEHLKYIWKISLFVYGRGVPNEEVSGIATKLWYKCFGKENLALSSDKSLQTINSVIQKISNADTFDVKKTNDLNELKIIIENIQKNFDELTNYNKIIKLFEIYRMMKNGNLCNN